MVEKFELSCFGEEENVLYMGVMVENWWKKNEIRCTRQNNLKIEIRKLVNVCVCSNKIMLLGVHLLVSFQKSCSSIHKMLWL